jgi:hypothetical protein
MVGDERARGRVIDDVDGVAARIDDAVVGNERRAAVAPALWERSVITGRRPA